MCLKSTSSTGASGQQTDIVRSTFIAALLSQVGDAQASALTRNVLTEFVRGTTSVAFAPHSLIALDRFLTAIIREVASGLRSVDDATLIVAAVSKAAADGDHSVLEYLADFSVPDRGEERLSVSAG